jgi:hypothetical protein
MPAEKCEGGQEYVDGKAGSVGDSSASHRLFQGQQAGPFAGESPLGLEDIAIPSGNIEQPAEHANADKAVEYALARRHAEPLARHALHEGGCGHCDPEGTCSPGHTHGIQRSGYPGNFGCRPEDKPEQSYLHGQEQ